MDFFREGSLLSRVTAGVMTGVLIGMFGFGMKLHATQETLITRVEMKKEIQQTFDYMEEHYTREEIIEVQYQTIIKRLDDIERKIDKLER